MDEIQAANFKVFQKVVEICEIENIPYVLLGGTLLGAVRHQGFIPWDDDMDVGFKRQDYDKFLDVAPQYLAGTEYEVYRDNTDKIAFGFSRIVNTNFPIKTKDNSSDFLFVDIFPLDKIPEDSALPYNKFRYVNIAINNRSNVDMHTSKLRGLIATMIGLSTKWMSLKKLKQVRYNLMIKYVDSELTNYHNLMSPYPFGLDYFSETEMKRFVDAKFEGLDVKIPEGSTRFLERLYGDWQTEPPVDERRTHLDN